MPEDAIVLFAHGARDPEWAEPFKKIQQRVARKLSGTRVELAFLEIMRPALAEAVATLVSQGSMKIRIIPLFLAQGGHLKHDLPKLVNEIGASHPGLSIEVFRAIGEVESVLDEIAQWACGEGK